MINKLINILFLIGKIQQFLLLYRNWYRGKFNLMVVSFLVLCAVNWTWTLLLRSLIYKQMEIHLAQITG